MTKARLPSGPSVVGLDLAVLEHLVEPDLQLLIDRAAEQLVGAPGQPQLLQIVREPPGIEAILQRPSANRAIRQRVEA